MEIFLTIEEISNIEKEPLIFEVKSGIWHTEKISWHKMMKVQKFLTK